MVIFWRHCNTLRISGFVDDVVFSYSWPHGGVVLPYPMKHLATMSLPCTPLVCGSGYVLDNSRRQYHRRLLCARGVLGQNVQCTIALSQMSILSQFCSVGLNCSIDYNLAY